MSLRCCHLEGKFCFNIPEKLLSVHHRKYFVRNHLLLPARHVVPQSLQVTLLLFLCCPFHLNITNIDTYVGYIDTYVGYIDTYVGYIDFTI